MQGSARQDVVFGQRGCILSPYQGQNGNPGQDVGTDGEGNFLADFREKPNPRGVARIEIDKVQFPRLIAGTYFIAFYFNRPTGPIEGNLTATVSGPLIDPVQPIAESTFDEDLDGWTRNDAPSPYAGTNVGDDASTIEFVPTGGNTGGSPDGYALIRDTRDPANEWFVAPDEFLVDFLALNEPRITFDLTLFTAFKDGNFFVEARLFGEEGSWRWVAPSGPPDPDGNWVSYSITMKEENWRVFEGNFMAFEQVFSNPKRLEIRASYTGLGNQTALDNVRLFVRGDFATPVLSAITSFSAGMDGWTRNYPASEQIELGTEGDKNAQLIWNEFEGNPEGFLRIVENGGSAPDAFVVPDLYLGNYHGLDSPRLEFDYRHSSLSGSTKPVEILLIGIDTSFRWTGVLPGDVWSRQTAFLEESQWTRVEGDRSFFSTLGFVKRIEISADLAEGAELNSVDNFSLLTADTPPIIQSISALPSTLTFAGVATGPNPEGAELNISASNGELRWEATVEGSLADRISLSAVEGDTPTEVSVQIDTQGLPPEIGEVATITFTAVGVTTDTAIVPVTLILGDQPNPTPVIFDNGIVNSGSYTPHFAGGVLGSIFGEFLGGPPEGALPSFIGRNNDTLPTHINGVRVLVFTPEGLLISEAPLTYLGDDQINFQLPFEAAGMGLVKIAVDNSGARSAMQTIPVTRAAPGIFTYDGGTSRRDRQQRESDHTEQPGQSQRDHHGLHDGPRARRTDVGQRASSHRHPFDPSASRCERPDRGPRRRNSVPGNDAGAGRRFAAQRPSELLHAERRSVAARNRRRSRIKHRHHRDGIGRGRFVSPSRPPFIAGDAGSAFPRKWQEDRLPVAGAAAG